MSSITDVIREKYDSGHVPLLEFNCPVLIKDRILNRLENQSRKWVAAVIIREALESVELVSRFEEAVEYIDFFPQVFHKGNIVTLSLRIRIAEDTDESAVLIDFPSAAQEIDWDPG